MIIAAVVAVIVGAVSGVASDELLRAGEPRTNAVMVAGIGGGIVGLIMVRWLTGDGGLLVDSLAAFVGAAVLAFATRARISSVVARRA